VTARFPRVASLRDAAALRARLAALGAALPCDDAPLAAPASPLAAPLAIDLAGLGRRELPNRFVIQPMEGWDGTHEGLPTALTERRWRRFGASGAAWIWGGEAVAVQADGRANPNQLLLADDTAHAVGALRRALLAEAERARGLRPVVGLQLTHSGRWSRPGARGRAPRIAFRDPVLDARVAVDSDAAVLGDAELEGIARAFARAAALAQAEGFDFVDLKHCHGYLLHELLSARARPGPYGGESLEARTRFLRELVGRVRVSAPGLALGVRLSVFDVVPHRPAHVEPDGSLGPGVPERSARPWRAGFGVDPEAPQRVDWSEPLRLVALLAELGVRLLNVTAACPYTAPHVQRPALFPPSDGYAPPEDPLLGVARLLDAARRVRAAAPAPLAIVSSGWTYLQEFVPHVAQACLREGWFDAAGLGRMALAYPELPADVLAGRALERKRLCRTFSDCTTAPRNGLVSGCYPLDDFYRGRPERESLEKHKRGGAA
jgi:2,4-dienoyl-CoA reductase-like NADH-dependent reductase (Old Yellow Enzyme family)